MKKRVCVCVCIPGVGNGMGFDKPQLFPAVQEGMIDETISAIEA